MTGSHHPLLQILFSFNFQLPATAREKQRFGSDSISREKESQTMASALQHRQPSVSIFGDHSTAIRSPLAPPSDHLSSPVGTYLLPEDINDRGFIHFSSSRP
ncbi:hypothetical protein U1Q18_021916 [Sarracenia purpurea var. burkii]